jgi:hypothetical protein
MVVSEAAIGPVVPSIALLTGGRTTTPSWAPVRSPAVVAAQPSPRPRPALEPGFGFFGSGNTLKPTRNGSGSAVPRDGLLAENASNDARFEHLRERYASQVAPAARLRMVRCDRCRATFFAVTRARSQASYRADAAFAMPGVYEFLEADRIEYAIRSNQIGREDLG